MIKRNLVVFLLFTCIGLLLNFSLLDNNFLSDDYKSLYRILIEKRIIYKGLFRPLIDVSFYLNYLLSGLNPVSYYLLNILIHCATAFMVYAVTKRSEFFPDKKQEQFSFLAGLFFLIYPFHNESIAWLTGRLSSIACLSAMIILYWSMNRNKQWKYFSFSALVFVFALTGYESIVLLPFIIFIWNREIRHSSLKNALGIFLAWSALLILTLVLRFILSGGLASDYGSRIFNGSPIGSYIKATLKTAGRLLLPPAENSILMKVVFSAIIIAVAVLHIAVIIRGRVNRRYMTFLLSLVFALLITIAFGGVSTRTTEGDRLLYFPSAFLCMTLSYATCSVSVRRIRVAIAGSICVYFLFFLLKNNRQWELASDVSKEVLRATADDPGRKKILINIPDELEGCYVFRQGFKEALVVNRLDTGSVISFNYLSRMEYLPLKEPIKPVISSNRITIYPKALFTHDGMNWNLLNNKGASIRIGLNTIIYYWDTKSLRRFCLR